MFQTFVRAVLCLVPLLGLTVPESHALDTQDLFLIGCKIYRSPTVAPLENATISISGATIIAIADTSKTIGKRDAALSRFIDCAGKTVVAGFWNSHAHFTEPAWKNAAAAPAAALEQHMRDMLTRWGVTTVWDLGSNPIDSLALRRRVESGQIAGPKMLLAGDIFPKGGHPVYLPAETQLPEAATPDQAAQMARNDLQMGLDGVKLFTGTFMGDKPVVNMDPAIAKAAVDVAHAQGKPVFAHPQNGRGVDVVLAAGVDVMAHTASSAPSYTPEQLAQFKAQGTALIPTLSLYTTVVIDPAVTVRLVQSGVDQLKTFAANGGPVLFGTDVGFTKLYDTSLEFELMHRALSEMDVLASLTTNPASYFKSARKGRVEAGFDADLVVLDGDPATDVRNLAKVVTTIRAGKIIYQKP
jgi:imidazolonepropionase-like amidohydrolase